MLRSVRAQITVSVALLVMLVVGLAGLVIALRIDHRDGQDVDNQLSVRAERVRADANKLFDNHEVGPGDGQKGGHDDGDYGGLLEGSQSRVRLLYGDQELAAIGEEPPAPVPMPTGDGFSTVVLGDELWRSLVMPLDSAGDRLQVLQSLEPVEQRFADNRSIVGVVAVLATLITALGVAVVSGVVLAPLERLRVAALGIRPTDPGARLPVVSRPKEVADLSTTLDRMLARLQTSMLSTRRFTADAGHELRTPLTSLGVDLETLRRNPDIPADERAEILDAMTVEHGRVVARLEGLQALARGDTGTLPEVAELDLAELVDDAVERAARRRRDTTYRLAPTADGLRVEGWATGLQLALDNLLDNAALHGRPGGTVEILLARGDGTARITVADDGPGIPAEHTEAMKQRFTRGDHPRSDGSGLGLALVDQQAALHGGTLELGRSSSGGLAATITLPLAGSRAGDVRR